MTTVKRQASFTMNISPEELFPLFSAEGEKLWVPGWDYENVMDGVTELHEDYVFLTANHSKPAHDDTHAHDHDHHDHHGHHRPDLHSRQHHVMPKTIWLVKRHDPANFFVQFYRVEPEDKVGIVTVHCKPITTDSTEVEVAYEFIGLSEKGNEFIKGYSAEGYEEFIGHWNEALTHYFETKSA